MAIHIHIYYNLSHTFETNELTDTYNTYRVYTREICVITDQNIVRRLLTNPLFAVNDIGEFTEYDDATLLSIVRDDLNDYGHGDFSSRREIESLYWVTCVYAPNISDHIRNFLS
jgi:hypothetical protein